MYHFIQFVSKNSGHGKDLLDYYYRAYNRTFGCVPEHTLEIPTWIPQLSGLLGASQKLHYVDNVEEFMGDFQDARPMLFISVTDAVFEKALLLAELASRRKIPVVAGGYVSKERIRQLAIQEVIWLDKLADIEKVVTLSNRRRGPSYELFRGQDAIPRLALSSGCTHNCRFCTIKREVYERRWELIKRDALSFEPLNFQYVYLDDKTFGQADNWRFIEDVADTIRGYNPNFKGFIVQTTALEVIKYGHDPVWTEHVKFVEIGVETVHEGWLRWMRKPHSLKQINKAIAICMSHDIKVIPNIITLFPAKDYEDEKAWLLHWKDTIPFINLFRLSCYEDSKNEEWEGENSYWWNRTDWFMYTPQNADETTFSRSWNKAEDVTKSKGFEAWTILTFMPCMWDIYIPRGGDRSKIATLSNFNYAKEWWREHFPEIFINERGEISVIEANNRE